MSFTKGYRNVNAQQMGCHWLSQALQYRVAFHLLQVGNFTYGSHRPCVDAAKEASMQSCLIMMSVSKKNPDNKNTPCVDALKLYKKVSEKNPDNKNMPCADALKKYQKVTKRLQTKRTHLVQMPQKSTKKSKKRLQTKRTHLVQI